MSKKLNKTAQNEEKKDFVGLSSQLKIDSPKDKLSNITSKEEFEGLFAEYNKYFIQISHEVSALDLLDDELLTYITQIQKAYTEKFGEPPTEENFSEDSDSDLENGNDSNDDKEDNDDSYVSPTKNGNVKNNETTEKEVVPKKTNKKTHKTDKITEEKEPVEKKKVVPKGKNKKTEENAQVNAPEAEPVEKKKVVGKGKNKKSEEKEPV